MEYDLICADRLGACFWAQRAGFLRAFQKIPLSPTEKGVYS